jgi:predicted Zn-dependent protease
MGRPDEVHEYFSTLKLRGEGRCDEAVDIYRNQLAVNPSDHKTRWNLAVTLSQQGKLDEALRESRATVSARPDNYTFRMTLVQVLLELKEWNEAITESRHLVQVMPDLAAPHSYVGRAHVGLGNLPAAIEAYEMAISCRGATPEMRQALGELHKR